MNVKYTRRVWFANSQVKYTKDQKKKKVYMNYESTFNV